MPAASAAFAITPPSASISRTRWPLPMPPMAGLQLIAPTVSMLCVSRSEEHTSEFQSLMRISYAVFCLQKKNHKHKDLSQVTDRDRKINITKSSDNMQ